MGVATGIAAGVGILGSGFQAIKGAQQARDAQRALENYQRQELRSPFEDVQVSTMSADLQREEQARLAAAQTEALQDAGVRGLVGGLGRVEAGNQVMNAQIGADLDEQQRQLDMALAQDRTNIRGMQEQREMQDISALSSQFNAGNQQFMAGLGGIAQTGMSALPMLDDRPQATQQQRGQATPLGQGLTPKGITQIPLNQPQQSMTNMYGGGGLGGMNLQFDEFGRLIF